MTSIFFFSGIKWDYLQNPYLQKKRRSCLHHSLEKHCIRIKKWTLNTSNVKIKKNKKRRMTTKTTMKKITIITTVNEFLLCRKLRLGKSLVLFDFSLLKRCYFLRVLEYLEYSSSILHAILSSSYLLRYGNLLVEVWRKVLLVLFCVFPRNWEQVPKWIWWSVVFL